MRTFACTQDGRRKRSSRCSPRSSATPPKVNHRPDALLHLQGAVGNQETERLAHAGRAGDQGSTAFPFSSLTPGNDDERMFQTAGEDASAIPANAFHTQFPGPLGPTPGPFAPPGPSHQCVPTVRNSNLPSGHIAATVSGGRFAAPFRMQADFDTPIPCNGVCGEYRQFVKGYSQVNGTDIVHPLCGNNMSRTTEHEDCLTSGSTNLMYGYHTIPFSTSRFTNPDQATGWSYRGFDAPGFNLASFPSGTVLNWNLTFRGELVDACDGDRQLQPSTTWTAGGTHTVA